MSIDVGSQIGAVRRGVSIEEREGERVRAVVASQTYDTSIDDLWDAITNPERIPRWFLPVSGDLRLGGRYALEGNASGEVTECEPPRRLGMTWEFGGGVTWVTVDLVSDDTERTTMELVHSAQVPDELWAEYGPGAVGVGWDLTLMGLREHLTGAPAIEPASAVAWTTSAEGRDFMTASSEAWRVAAVAGGDDEEAAAAAAARTIAAYAPGGVDG